MRKKLLPLIVGELNPYGSDPRTALFPLPRRASGDRLRVILGMTDGIYLASFDRVNLCTGRWDEPTAVAHAVELFVKSDYRKFVLLGAKVTKAFGFQFVPFSAIHVADRCCAILPHPSGLSRAWNDSSSAGLARDILRVNGMMEE